MRLETACPVRPPSAWCSCDCPRACTSHNTCPSSRSRDAPLVVSHSLYPFEFLPRQVGLNALADLTPDEFRRQYGLGAGRYKRARLAGSAKVDGFAHGDLDEAQLPPAVDWRQKGAVAEVKNQAAVGRGPATGGYCTCGLARPLAMGPARAGRGAGDRQREKDGSHIKAGVCRPVHEGNGLTEGVRGPSLQAGERQEAAGHACEPPPLAPRPRHAPPAVRQLLGVLDNGRRGGGRGPAARRGRPLDRR
jgi:hypothetical protein